MSGRPDLPAPIRRAVQRRALLVQGSWTYRVMQGTGMAFAILPVLRHVHGTGEALERSLGLHAEHFNAHPYFSSVALGALTRLEVDGVDPETVRRFRAAIRGPLGALGDRVVWATWLPLAAVVALVLYWTGVPGWLAATAFLVLFNAVHLAIRVRGFRIGFEAGTAVGPQLRSLGLTNRAERAGPPLLALVGLLVGLLLFRSTGMGALGGPWIAAAVAAFAAGLLGGVRLWRPTAILTVGVVAIALAYGFGYDLRVGADDSRVPRVERITADPARPPFHAD